MLIAFMINAKLQEHRILHNKHPTDCTKKEQSVETVKESYLMNVARRACLMAVQSACTCVLAHAFRVGIFLCTCVYVGPVDFPSEKVVILHHRAHCVCFFSLTPDLQPRCDPLLFSDWPELTNLKANKQDGGEKKGSYWGLPILTTSS